MAWSSGKWAAFASRVESEGLASAEGAIAAVLTRIAPASLLFVFAVYLLPYLAGAIDRSLAGVGLAVSALACALALTEPRSSRRIFVSLFAVSLAAHLSAMVLIVGFQSPPGSIYLGPDGSVFWRGTEALAAAGLRLETPFTQLGTFDVAHYYVFAATLLAFGGGLASLQLLNLAATALVGSIAYTIARRALPGYAVLIGVVVALHPSLIALSLVDLRKDPLIAVAIALVLGAIASLLDRPSRSQAVFLSLVATGAFLFMRMDRFYVAVMLEVAAVLAAGLVAWRARHWGRSQVLTAALIGSILLIGEVVPLALGSRLSSELFVANAQLVRDTPLLRDYAPSVFERDVPPSPTDAPSTSIDSGGPLGAALLVLNLIIDALRRVFGPFIWVPPSDFRLEALSAADFSLYPGTLLWYAAMPFVLLGVTTILWRAIRRRPVPFVLLLFAIFTVAYATAYMGINLSYRHREVMTPLLFLFVPMGFASAVQHRLMWPLYLSYVAGLALLAVVDIVAHRLL